MSFIHLKLHTEYSIKDGVVRIKDLIKSAKSLNMSAVAVTDFSNLFAMVKFYQKAIAEKIKPIIGVDLLVKDEEAISQITLLCQDQTGYSNLTCLISRAYREGQTASGVPQIEMEWLEGCCDGLLLLSGASAGNVGIALLAGDNVVAEKHALQWERLFPNRFYLELQRIGKPREEDYIHAAVALAEKLQLPVVATNDVRFIERDDFEAHEARVCIHEGYVLEDKNRPRRYTEQQYLRDDFEMKNLFVDIPEALENTVEIAKRCNLKLELGRVCLPQFPVPEGMSVDSYLQQQSEQGLRERLDALNLKKEQEKEYYDRLKRELDVIIQMGFPGYFLIVADFIQWAKEHGIPVGPGRGSGAGSIVAYALKITALDPIEHELLFERFLNPERVSMPDFDVDFCMEQRDRVIDYVAQHYGRDAVSQIITYGTMAAKAVVRDVGRVLGYPYGFCDKLAKLIPFELGITLEKALVQEQQLADRYNNEEEVTILFDLALKLEGVTRNAGKHAGGVVIAPGKLTDFAPLYCEPGGENLVTQFDKDDVEAVGLVKFDFLGLRTLTIINWAVQNVNAKRKKRGEAAIDIEKIPLDDVASFDLLKSCATTAVFQLESRGMKDLIRRIQPDSFDEITALVALFRPGPLQSGMVDDFIDRKHGRAKIDYPHAEVESILKPTYGVILYQEQVMQIAQVLAGYSLGAADILRRAMGKKKAEEMAKQREVFTEGAVGRGIDRAVAEHIFDLMEKFAGYGFNKSHSAAYALIAYQTAWLKAHYPAEFMAAVLSSDMDNTDKVVGFVHECKSMGLTVTPPDINHGYYHFTVNDNDEIVYGLGAVKGVGEAAIEHIVAERQQNGAFKDLFEFCQRLDLHKVSKRVLEPCIRSGAFDAFNEERSTMFASVKAAMKSAEQKNRDALIGQSDLFGVSDHVEAPVNYINTKAWSERKRLECEKVVLGLYITGHPINAYISELKGIVSVSINALQTYTKSEVLIAGMITSLRIITMKNGRRLCVIMLEDQTGSIEITIFNKLFEVIRDQLIQGEIFVIRGKIEDDKFSGGVRIVAENVQSLNDYRSQLAKRILINVDQQMQVDRILSELPTIIEPYKGKCPVNIAYDTGDIKAELALGKHWSVAPLGELLEKISDVCGFENVVVQY